MTFRGLGISLSNEDPVDVTVALSQEADALGYDEVSIPESRLFHSVTTVAAAVLAATENITVRIGIASPVFRHPVALALEAATLDEMAPGRVRFGVGAAEWTMKALGTAPPGWRPYTNTIEAVRAMRSLTAGETLGFAPETFAASPDVRLDMPRVTAVPVDIGAVSPRMMEAVGAYADGVQLGDITSVGYTEWSLDRVAAGAARAGRRGADLLVSGNVLTSVDNERTAARDAVREVLAYYLSRVEGVVVDESGADVVHVAEVRDAVSVGGVKAGAAAVTDHLIDVFAVAGTVDDVIAGLSRFVDAGLSLPLVWHTLGPDPAKALRTIATYVRPALAG